MKHSKLCFVLFICLLAFGCESTNAPSSTSSSKTEVKKAPDLPPLQAGEEIAVIEMEGSKKPIKLRLFSDVAPKHVENFKRLINEKFYDGLAFHRVMKDVMIQGGDPTTRGDDRSKWGMGDESLPKVKAEFNSRPFVKGTLGAARSQDPNSASTQFFICFSEYPAWNGEYTNFGQVIEGISEVQVLSNAPTEPNSNGKVEQKLVIKRIYLEKYQPK